MKINLLKKYKHNRKAYTDGKAGIIAKLLKEAFAWSYLGKTVTVTVLKSLSEKCVPVYSGYIEGVTDDNESQEVYVIGVKKPGCVYTGTVTAIIYGQDNTPGKWVVAPAEASFNQAQIAEVILPFEQDTDVFIDSVHRKSCGVIVYRIVDGNIEYLLVKEYYCYGWSIPKGHMEAGESESDTAIREAWEEVGVRVTPDMGFIRTVEYTIQPVYKKEVVFRISEFNGESRVVKPGIEATGWFVLSEAKKLLKYQETCAVMEDAEAYIAGLHKGGQHEIQTIYMCS
ncbi:MAG: Diadenosine hexaphosphate hydrolase [Firmicutes bacterium ADurb.Bin099]|nr:MAG: Diadenosine hexaphosphate hydrolase [Firmicutes bacterium ADurb.Bin099]